MSQNVPVTRRYVDIAGFPDGVNSFLDPQFIKDTQSRWAENAVNKGGIWQTRPGWNDILALCKTTGTPFYNWWIAAGQPAIHPQFFTVFQPINDDPQAIFGISGTVFKAHFLENGTVDAIQVVPGISLDPTVPQICVVETVKSTDIVSGRVVNIAPKKVLMIQDGVSRAAYFDGNAAGHLNPQKLYRVDAQGNTIFASGYNGTRIGLWMAWSGNRLWVFNGPTGYASDLGDPLHFTEETVLVNVPSFTFPENVTACIDRGTSGIQQSLLFVFTRSSTFTLWSGIQQRSQWIATGDFQRTVFSGVGCVAGKSPINHMGLLHWYSEAGAVAFDSFGTVTATQALPPIDSEMAYSKQRISPDKSLICAGKRDSYVFWSVPMGPVSSNGRVYNNHTQVMDKVTVPVHIGVGTAIPYGIASWQGVWTGIRPVQWSTATIWGKTRSFCMSMDFDNNVRIWEAFQGNRSDNGRQIAWSLETKSHGVTDTPFTQAIFRHMRVLCEQIYGNLTITGAWRGLRGAYHQLLSTNVTATPGSVLLAAPGYTPLTQSTVNESFAKQFRDIRSKDNREPDTTCQSTNVEAPYNDGRDRAFSLLFRMNGVGAIKAYRLAVDALPEDTEGEVVKPETGFHILPEDSCPKFIAGTTPDYVLQNSPLQDAFVPFQSRFTEEQYVSPVAPC